MQTGLLLPYRLGEASAMTRNNCVAHLPRFCGARPETKSFADGVFLVVENSLASLGEANETPEIQMGDTQNQAKPRRRGTVNALVDVII